ncbi:MAG TPA: HAMP domain-containing sensor histidine kinase [bacterium]|nr:HAMP domain-containing sensor histidine kinase [bacterium]HOL34696.1 HAMP domain-containing sensor histidine kinase [bacterium]HPP08051.1 HAMP domain-containing sensor histidine kinase [bacterium]
MSKKKKRNPFSEALEAVIKPIEFVVNPVVVKPVEFLADKVNLLIKGLEQKTFTKEKISEVDNFVDGLLENMKTIEKSFYPFLSEVLLIHNLAESMATLANEIELLSILGNQLQKVMKVDIIVGFLKHENEKTLIPGYKMLPENFLLPDEFYSFVQERFDAGEVQLYENTKIGNKKFHLLITPLRTTSEKFGIFLIGRKRSRGTFTPEETTLILAGSTMVSFALSNFKLNQKILRDRQLVILGQTIGSISHDIKNLLTGLEGGIEMVNNGLQDKNFQEIETGVGILNRSYQRIKAMVLSMLDYAKDRAPELSLCDFNNVVAETVSIVKASFKDRNIKVIENYDTSIPQVAVDPERIDRMVSNLLLNAIDAVEEKKGVITISTRYLPETKLIELEISDNGKGIPENALNKIFDLFYSTKGSRGTGFGLAIVQKVVREHDGKILVSSKPGEGTTFLIQLPARVAAENTSTTSQ